METQNSALPRKKSSHIKNLALWTGAWLITMAFASFNPLFLWEDSTTLSIISIIVNIGVGIGMIIANREHLQNIDELQRKIQLEAMGVTLGLAVVLGLAYSLLAKANIISYNAEISHLVILIGITYLTSVIIGNYRYQ